VTHLKVFFQKSLSNDFRKKSCACHENFRHFSSFERNCHDYNMFYSCKFLLQVTFKSDFQKKTFQCVTTFTVEQFNGAGILRNADCGRLSKGNLRKNKCGTFRKLPLVAFLHSATEKFRISADRKTTVRPHCTTDVPPMHTIPWSLEKWKIWKIAQCWIVHQTKH